MKRFRDSAGHLTMRVEKVAAATLEEAAAYYKTGEKYIHQGREYICTRWQENGTDCIRFDYCGTEEGQFLQHLYCDPARMGTFLPGVASDGLEIEKSGYVMKKGDMIHTPRFLNVCIEEVLTRAEAKEKGYREPTHFENHAYDVFGKSIGQNRMIFAGVKKED